MTDKDPTTKPRIPWSLQGLKVDADEMRLALEKAAAALDLPGTPSNLWAVPAAVERLVAERDRQAALIERLQLCAAFWLTREPKGARPAGRPHRRGSAAPPLTEPPGWRRLAP